MLETIHQSTQHNIQEDLALKIFHHIPSVLDILYETGITIKNMLYGKS
jgi:hypothetical protein